MLFMFSPSFHLGSHPSYHLALKNLMHPYLATWLKHKMFLITICCPYFANSDDSGPLLAFRLRSSLQGPEILRDIHQALSRFSLYFRFLQQQFRANEWCQSFFLLNTLLLMYVSFWNIWRRVWREEKMPLYFLWVWLLFSLKGPLESTFEL